jgi:hypothetical protein
MSSPTPLPNTDRRKEPRFESKGLADLLVYNARIPERLTASVTNVSRSGLMLLLSESVEEGRQIELRLKQVIVSGVVTNCERDGKGHYRAGIRTINVTDSPLRTRHIPEADLELFALGKSLSEAQREHYAGHLKLCVDCKGKVPEIAAPPARARKEHRRPARKSA